MTRILGFLSMCMMAVFTIAMVFMICGYTVDTILKGL